MEHTETIQILLSVISIIKVEIITDLSVVSMAASGMQPFVIINIIMMIRTKKLATRILIIAR